MNEQMMCRFTAQKSIPLAPNGVGHARVAVTAEVNF